MQTVKRPLWQGLAATTFIVGFWTTPSLALSTHSSPIAITSDDKFVWVVNRENDSVSVLKVQNDTNTKEKEITVGDEPRCVALTPDDAKVYVTNTVDGTVSVINANTRHVIKTIKVGTEPVGCALTPDGTRLYVANQSSDSVSVINTENDKVVYTTKDVGPKPRGIAITEDGKKVYVTQFLAQLRAGKSPADEAQDDAKEGRVTVISTKTNRVIDTVGLDPLTDVGFASNGSTLKQVAFNAADPTTVIPTIAYPNLLQGIALKGNRAYVPNTCQSPDGPFKFNVNVQSCLSVFNILNDQDSDQTINMNKGVNFENIGQKLFNTNPIDIAFERNGNEGWVALAATDRILRVQLAPDGTPTINAPTAQLPPGALSNIVRVEVGKNPQGIVLNSTDTRAYVMNFISRDVSVVNLAVNPPVKIKDILATDLPTPGTQAAIVHHGNELFNTAIGPEGTQDNARRPAGRMSDFGWGSCYGCHPDGLADGTTWIFPDGPRATISMERTFENPQPISAHVNENGAPILPGFHQRVLNWSAVRDECQDFERNIRLVSGGEGLIVGEPITNVPDLTPIANTGRSADLDALCAYVAFGLRAPISPINKELVKGRKLFEAANCQSCHGGSSWTRSVVDFAPPPAANEITDAQLARFLEPVGTFDPNAFNEFKSGAGGVQTVVGPANQARGVLGFNIPSLMSVFAGAPYLHNGACEDLDCVLDNVQHRSAGTNGVDTLTKASDRKALIEFMKYIDPDTKFFP
jgi:YVTN family beta-propeller protein